MSLIKVLGIDLGKSSFHVTQCEELALLRKWRNLRCLLV